MTGTSCIIVGFSFANDVGCRVLACYPPVFGLTEVTGLAASTLLLICLGLVVLLGGAIYERYTSRDCLFPPTAFTDLTTGTRSFKNLEIYDLICDLTVITLIITFLHQVTFTSGTFYLALFYQVIDYSYHSVLNANLNSRPLVVPLRLRLALSYSHILSARLLLPCPPHCLLVTGKKRPATPAARSGSLPLAS